MPCRCLRRCSFVSKALFNRAKVVEFEEVVGQDLVRAQVVDLDHATAPHAVVHNVGVVQYLALISGDCDVVPLDPGILESYAVIGALLGLKEHSAIPSHIADAERVIVHLVQ